MIRENADRRESCSMFGLRRFFACFACRDKRTPRQIVPPSPRSRLLRSGSRSSNSSTRPPHPLCGRMWARGVSRARRVSAEFVHSTQCQYQSMQIHSLTSRGRVCRENGDAEGGRTNTRDATRRSAHGHNRSFLPALAPLLGFFFPIAPACFLALSAGFRSPMDGCAGPP